MSELVPYEQMDRAQRETYDVGKEAWRLRLHGLTVVEIFERIEPEYPGIWLSEVADAIEEYAKHRAVESDAVAKALELDRLDALWSLALTIAAEGNVKALDSARRIGESRRQLLGLNAPDKREISLGVGKSQVDHDIEKLVAEMRATDDVMDGL